jgi:hypothetical protein
MGQGWIKLQCNDRKFVRNIQRDNWQYWQRCSPTDDLECDIVLAKYTAHLRDSNRRAPYFGFIGTVSITLKDLDPV